MLRYLLDEHISPAVAASVKALRAEIDIVSLPLWEEGTYLGAPDDVLLRAAHAAGRTLVTFDQHTIVPLLRAWGQGGSAHGGVVFISSATYAVTDVGGIARALVRLWEDEGAQDWSDVALYLRGE
jgi:hypothetical protein